MEKLIYDGHSELGPAIGFAQSTVKRFETDDPDRLPDPVPLGPDGLSGKKVYLVDTVRAWLQAREDFARRARQAAREAAAAAAPPPAAHSAPAGVATEKRGRGRPRKLVSTTVGSSS